MSPANRSASPTKSSRDRSAQAHLPLVLECFRAREIHRRIIAHPLYLVAQALALRTVVKPWQEVNPYAPVAPPNFIHSYLTTPGGPLPLVRLCDCGHRKSLLVGNKALFDWAWHYDHNIVVEPIEGLTRGQTLLDHQLATVPIVVVDILSPSPFYPNSYDSEFRSRFILMLCGELTWPGIPIESPDVAGVRDFFAHAQNIESLRSLAFGETKIKQIEDRFRIKPSTKSKIKVMAGEADAAASASHILKESCP